MVQPPGGGPRCAGLGIANGLTLLRALASWLLLAYGLTGVQSRTLLLGAFAMGAATDAVDGMVARRVEVATRMGRMLDAMADTLLFSIGALVLADRGFVPGWFAVAVLARYAIPFAWALVSYFLQLRPVRYAPTIWGKSAGVALATAFAAALLDPGLEARHAHAARAGLWLICFLLCAAMAVQLWLEYRRWAPARGMGVRGWRDPTGG
jgi:phosphatidylglycerophosphate synthase